MSTDTRDAAAPDTHAYRFQEALMDVVAGMIRGERDCIVLASQILLDLGNAAVEIEGEAQDVDDWLNETPAENETQHAIGNAQYYAYEHAYAAMTKTFTITEGEIA